MAIVPFVTSPEGQELPCIANRLHSVKGKKVRSACFTRRKRFWRRQLLTRRGAKALLVRSVGRWPFGTALR
jgi:hypothetical protein